MTNASPVNPGDILAGKYKVDCVLGVGGMGVVVQATHTQLEERVALKFMLPEAMQNPEISGRFLREARLAVKLKSEHVAKVMDVGTLDTGSPYIVMEYLEGTDLNRVLEKHGPLPFADVAEYIIQACDAVAEAHAMGIVHRDLKPANLFLARRPDGAPLVKVLDFGISKANALSEGAGGMTKTSTMMGSPYFMSPEQMRSAKDVDARSDVWSVGVIIYQLLTARLPFESDTLGGIMAQVLQDDPADLSVHRPDVPHAFQAVVSRCLVRDRNGRAQSVAEVALMLAPYAPTRARPIAERIAGLLGTNTRAPGADGGRPSMPSNPADASVPPPAPKPVLGGLPASGDTGSTTTPAGVPKKGSGAGLVIGLVVAACAAGGIWWFTRKPAATPEADKAPPPASTVQVATAEPAKPATPPAQPAQPTMPAATQAAPPAPPPTTAPEAPPVEAKHTPVGATRPPPGPAPKPPAPTPPPAGPKKSVLDDRN